MKLYRHNRYPNRWYAHSKITGWVMFPSEANGWTKREPARGIDPLYVREVPAKLAEAAGMPLSAETAADWSQAA